MQVQEAMLVTLGWCHSDIESKINRYVTLHPEVILVVTRLLDDNNIASRGALFVTGEYENGKWTVWA